LTSGFVLSAHVHPGRAAAIKFSKAYPVVLLARTPQSYQDTVKEINDAGGKAIGLNADASSVESLTTTFETISKELPDHKLAAVVFNPSAGFPPRPFLEVKLEELNSSIDVNMYACSPI
jgi:NAD(P)-dependent dehydrogenase (short-subunit alcohol dehydrogenase family)